MLRQLTCIAVAAVLAATAGTAWAANPEADRFNAAVGAVRDKLGPMEAFREPPTLADPVFAASMSDIKATMAVFGTPAFPVDQMNTFETVCTPLNEFNVRYMLSGLEKYPEIKTGGAAAQAKLMEISNANTVKYQDIIVVFMTGGVKCLAAHMPFMTETFRAFKPEDMTPARLNGLRQLRGGVAQLLVGTVMMTGHPQFKADNKQVMIGSVATYLRAFTPTLTLAERKAILGQIRAAGPNLARDYPAEFKAISDALTDTACTDLCTVS